MEAKKTNKNVDVELKDISPNQTELLLKYINQLQDVNQKTSTGNTLLMFAVSLNSEKVLEKLISKGADLTIRNKNGFTALMFAAADNKEKITNILIKNKSDVDAKDNSGRSALIHAVIRHNINIVKILLSADANINAKDDFGWNALMWAAAKNYKDIVEILIKSKADLQARDNNGFSAFTIAVSRGSFEVEDMFLKLGVDVKKEFATILLTSKNYSLEEIFKLFSSDKNSNKSKRSDSEPYDNTFNSKLHFYMNKFCKEQNKKQCKIYQYNSDSNCTLISKQNFSRILTKSNKDQNYRPKRKRIILLAIGMKLNLTEFEDFLESAGYHFSENNKIDLIIKPFFEKKDYNIFHIDEAVHRYTGKSFWRNDNSKNKN